MTENYHISIKRRKAGVQGFFGYISQKPTGAHLSKKGELIIKYRVVLEQLRAGRKPNSRKRLVLETEVSFSRPCITPWVLNSSLSHIAMGTISLKNVITLAIYKD